MKSQSLSRERLARIQNILVANPGLLTVRSLARSYGVWSWEIEQAAAIGVLIIETRRPRTGRSSRCIRAVSKPEAAKLPPFRWQIEKPISIRHQLFALHSAHAVRHGSHKLVSLPSITDAYQSVFKRATNRRAASASASRLMRRGDVRAARAWYHARFEGDVPRGEQIPDTVADIWQRLRELGSWRAAPLR